MDEAEKIRIGAIAASLTDERDAVSRKHGGISPAKLQEYAGRYLSAINPNFENTSVGAALSVMAAQWEQVQLGTPNSPSQQEFAAELTLVAMQIAYIYAFDLYEASYELLDLWLENAMVRMAHARRLVNKTTEEGQTIE